MLDNPKPVDIKVYLRVEPDVGGFIDRRIQVLTTKPGSQGHDWGATAIARASRDTGVEVVYIGSKRTPEQIANAAAI